MNNETLYVIGERTELTSKDSRYSYESKIILYFCKIKQQQK